MKHSSSHIYFSITFEVCKTHFFLSNSILEYASIVWGDKNNKVLTDSMQVPQNKAAKLVLDRATLSSSTQALLDLNWMNLSCTRRTIQRCLFMYNFINDSERNSMITRGTDYHSHNTRSKEAIISIRSKTNWGLLRSFNRALTDWNFLPEDTRCLPYNTFKISFLKYFKSK